MKCILIIDDIEFNTDFEQILHIIHTDKVNFIYYQN